jgi:hypothetical protein
VLLVLIGAALVAVLLAQEALRLVVLLPLQGFVPLSVALVATPLLVGLVCGLVARQGWRLAISWIVLAMGIGLVNIAVSPMADFADHSDRHVSVVAVSPDGVLEVAAGFVDEDSGGRWVLRARDHAGLLRRYGDPPLAFLCYRPDEVTFVSNTRVLVRTVDNDWVTLFEGTVEVNPRTLQSEVQLDDDCG